MSRQSGEERDCRIDDRNFSVAVLALAGGTHLAAKMVGDELKSVTNAEHRLTQFKNRRIGIRCVGVIDRAGAARQNNAERFVALYFFELRRAGKDYGKDVLLANAAGNELSVLGAKIKD